MRPASPRPTICGVFQVTLASAVEDHQAQGRSISSMSLGELWFARVKQAKPILSFEPILGQFPLLESICDEALPGLLSGVWSIELPREQLLSELRSLGRDFVVRQEWPKRHFFSLDCPAPAPTYSYRKMKTGLMVAGFDWCMINRNWDGTDRIEDLTRRDRFTDIAGEILIQGQPLSSYLGSVLEEWIVFLESLSQEQVGLCFARPEVDPDGLLVEVLERAERWREHMDLPDYSPKQLSVLSAHWKRLITQRKPELWRKEAGDIGAYVAEMMRAQLGGTYRPKRPDEGAPTFGQSKPEKALAEPAVALAFPFDCSSLPLEKAVRSLLQKRDVNWALQLEVFTAQRRQRGLLLQLGRELYSTSVERQHAALSLLLGIPDGRVDRMFVDWLAVCDEPEHLMAVMDRLHQARVRAPSARLATLTQHQRVGVVARALWLLAAQKHPGLPELIARALTGGGMPALRPLARHLLERFGKEKQEKARARQVLRSLGPIPPARSKEALYPDPPMTFYEMPVMAEILEDCDLPDRREAALQVLTLYPNREESDALGAALADPIPEVRMATTRLLSETDRPVARQLLQTRLLFEQDGPCRRLLQEALGAG